MDSNFGLIMPFLDSTESFCYGFECGIIWQQMERKEKIQEKLIHTTNLKQIELMCKRFGYSFDVVKLNEDWASLTAQLDLTKVN